MRLLTTFLVACFTLATQANEVYTVIANPGENASNSIRINWHSDIDSENTYCLYTECNDTNWEHSKKAVPQSELCTAFDSMYSKTADNKNIYEQAKFIRNTIELNKLKPGTKYMYKIVPCDNSSETYYFKTAPVEGVWTAGIISDFHAYTPIPNRVKSAMNMIKTLEQCNNADLDMMLHVGDIIAWGGSYSFWKDLYTNEPFKKYVWAGVNGNHDNMDRTNKKNTNNFFRYANNNPENGYTGEIGVCYHFTYGNTLFIMLNNENMRSKEGLAAAQDWVRKVIKENPAKFTVVMEHYQWFFGTSGKFSQYTRWNELFDECGVDLAIGANNHIYARTNAIYQGKETDGSKGTIYIQTTSSDNERGQAMKEWTDNKDIIKYRWCEGPKSISGLTMKNVGDKLYLKLYDRYGNIIDTVTVLAKK